MLKRVLGIIAIAGVLNIILAICIWLNAPGSFFLAAEGLREEHNPVDFEIEYVGLSPTVTRVPVELFYMPKTPIYGITEHYTSIISPLTIDPKRRRLEVPVRDARVRFAAPLGLAGFSNYRLQSVNVGDSDAPYALEAFITNDWGIEPLTVDIPPITVRNGDYRFDGAIALWRRPGDTDENRYVYAPRIEDVPRPVIWNGLRDVRARIDLTPYPIATFVVPGDYAADGWQNEGWRLTRPHATLTNKILTVVRGVSVPLPFARECQSPPEFAVVDGHHIPAWGRLYGLWRPVSRGVWDNLRRGVQTPNVTVRFIPSDGAGASIDRMERFAVVARTNGTYRLFAACPNSHYDSVGVTWIDIVASRTAG